MSKPTHTGCATCGNALGVPFRVAPPDYDGLHCSEECYKAAQPRPRGRPALGPAAKRAQRLIIYVTQQEREELGRQAEQRGLTLSEYLRRRGLGRRLPRVSE